MLKMLVLLLALANAGYFAWAQGSLAAYGLAPATQSEPQRLTQQIRPDAIRLQPPAPQPGAGVAAPAASTSISTSTSASTPADSDTVQAARLAVASAAANGAGNQCLQTGVYTEEQASRLRSRLLTTLPEGSWAFESGVEPARWLVYMGRYADAEAVNKKKGELRQRGVSYQALDNPALEPGLSLGSFPSQAEAEAELVRVAQRGVKTARVLQGQAETRGQRLKFASVDGPLRARLDAARPVLLGKTLLPCR